MVGLHVVAMAEVGKLTMTRQPLGSPDASPAIKGRRPVDYALDGTHEATIYNGDAMQPGMELTGPAVIEDAGTTVVVHPGNRVRMDGYRNLVITVKGL